METSPSSSSNEQQRATTSRVSCPCSAADGDSAGAGDSAGDGDSWRWPLGSMRSWLARFLERDSPRRTGGAPGPDAGREDEWTRTAAPPATPTRSGFEQVDHVHAGSL